MRIGKMSVRNRRRLVNRFRNEMRQSLNAKFFEWRNPGLVATEVRQRAIRKPRIAREIKRYGKLAADSRTFRYPQTIGNL